MLQQGKTKGLLGRNGSPFPFSAYIIKSYSSESPEHRPQSKTKNNDLEQEEFLGLIKGLKLKQVELLDRIERVDAYSRKHVIIDNALQALAQSDLKARKPVYRTRQKKLFPLKNQPNVKSKISQHKSLICFYRYQVVSLLTLLNRRQDYLNSLRGKKLDFTVDPLKPNEIQDRLKKQIQSKGKDRGRTKFNLVTNQQLRSLKYKPKINYNSISKKQSKVNYDQDEEEEEEQLQERQEKIIDFNTWKKQNGVGYNQKVFIVKGGYAQLRRALVDKGWYENQDVWSPFFDLKWTTRICDINFMQLKTGQAVNHFNNNQHLTSKYGITRRLKTLIIGSSIDVDKFYPRCFDLGDQTDFQNFVENFKFGFAESVARRFLVDKKRYQGRQLKVRVTLDILRRRTTRFSTLINNINRGDFPTITPQQWLIITQTAEFDEQTAKEKLEQWRKGQVQDPENPQYFEILYNRIDQKIRQYLGILRNSDPQIDINGWRNVWIAKPNCNIIIYVVMSRGRGIRCFNNLYDISDYCLGRDVQFVVQKYIENPLLVEGKKFDIRQWVLIQDFNPPKIWFYEECYIRFCADDYSLDNIYNRFIHLTNNSVQKYNKNHMVEKSMWTMKQFAEFIGQEKWKIVQQKMKNIIVWSIKSCQGVVIGKKGSCQLVGYDFMIDQNLNPWLIEINMSPSMDYSTPVTKRLVKMVLQDTAKVISSSKRHKNTGLFSCIYKHNDDAEKFNIYRF